MIQAKTFSCKSRATCWRRRATGLPAQSHTHRSADVPPSSEPISSPRPQRLRRAARGRMQQRPGAELGAGQRLHLVGVGHRALHRQAGAAADVAGQADADAGVLGRGPAEQAAAEEQVGAGAEGDLRAVRVQPRAVGIVEPDAVGQHRARVQQAVALVDVEVAARLGEQLGHPAHLVAGSRPRGSACTGPSRLASSRPAMASCASLLVGAKRGVTA